MFHFSSEGFLPRAYPYWGAICKFMSGFLNSYQEKKNALCVLRLMM